MRPPDGGSLALSLAGQHPIRESAAVSFVLPAAGRVTLRVLDLEGREALRPLDAALAAGAHRASWSMAGVAPGVYFARLESGGCTASVRLARVR